MRGFAGLRRAGDFHRLRRFGRRISTGAFTLYRSDAQPGDACSLVGIAVNSSIGKAVVRNKIRRRVSAILQQALAGRRPMRLLVVARPDASTAPFETLRAHLERGLA